MKYSKEFLETNARLKTLDKEALNDELNKMTFDELLAHRDYMIREELGEENLIPEERRQEQIKKLQQMTREPSAVEVKSIRIHSHRNVKRIVALVAAIVVLISVFMVAAVASKRDFSILNGIVRFEDGKVYIHLSRTEPTVSAYLTDLETDLKAHGFVNVHFPKCFYAGMWEIKDIVYRADESLNKASLIIESADESYSISIIQHFEPGFSKDSILFGAEGGETILSGSIPVYVFDHGDGRSELIYYTDNLEYSISSVSSFEKMKTIAVTVG